MPGKNYTAPALTRPYTQIVAPGNVVESAMGLQLPNLCIDFDGFQYTWAIFTKCTQAPRLKSRVHHIFNETKRFRYNIIVTPTITERT